MIDLENLLANRVSLRRFANKEINPEDLELILNGTLRAPTAGNMMLYSIIKITDPNTKKALSITCDNQPFIAQAPLILVFCADFRRWQDYYKLTGVPVECEKRSIPFSTPQEGDLSIAIMDTLIASGYTSIIAESLGIGSCYIGDIVESYEKHRELLNLPQWVMPIGMLVLGYYPDNYRRQVAPRYDKKFIVFEESYQRLNDEELKEMFAEKEEKFNPNNKFAATNFGQFNYFRKTGTDFTAEMTRSMKVMLENWCAPDEEE